MTVKIRLPPKLAVNLRNGLRLRRRAPVNPGDKDWTTRCEVCGEVPTVHPTGLCGVCCFGEADCAGGNW